MEKELTTSIFDELEKQRPSFENAAVGQRFLNLLIDSIVYCIVCFICLVLAFVIADLVDLPDEALTKTPEGDALFTAIVFGTYFLYYWFAEAFAKGRTLGKYLTKTKVVTEDANEINGQQAFLRTLCRFIPFEVFSGLTGNPWHDKITKTRVVKQLTGPQA